MSSPRPPRKPKLKHWVEYLIYRGFEGALSIVSVRSTYLIGELIGRLAYHLLPRYRKLVLRNLCFAYGDDKSLQELHEMGKKIFESTSANFLSALKIPTVSEDEIRKHVTFEGAEHLSEITQNGKGVVLLVPHMGNWELLAQAVFLAGYPITIGTHYRPLNNPLLNKLIENRRSQKGVKLFAKYTSSHQLTAFIKEGSFLGILADQRVGSKGEPVEFFGRPTTASPLPSLLARRSKATLMGLHCETTGIGKWKVCFSEVSGASIQDTASFIEELWKRSPEDVFWFGDRWKIDGPHLKKFYAAKHQSLPVSKKIRLVQLTQKGSAHYPLPESNLVALEQYAVDPSFYDSQIAEQLEQLDAYGHQPVDAFIVKEEHQPRFKKLASKIPVISEEELEA